MTQKKQTSNSNKLMRRDLEYAHTSMDVFRMLIGIQRTQFYNLVEKGVFVAATRDDGYILIKTGLKIYVNHLLRKKTEEMGGVSVKDKEEVKLKLELLKYNRERALLVYRPGIEHLLTESYQQVKKSLSQMADNVLRRVGGKPKPNEIKDIVDDEVRRIERIFKVMPEKIEREFGEVKE